MARHEQILERDFLSYDTDSPQCAMVKIVASAILRHRCRDLLQMYSENIVD